MHWLLRARPQLLRRFDICSQTRFPRPCYPFAPITAQQRNLAQRVIWPNALFAQPTTLIIADVGDARLTSP